MSANTIPVYEALACDMRDMGVETIFGLMSDDTAMLVSHIDSVGVRFVGGRHESNTVAMADGYASATGKLGIALIGRGPATANGMNGMVYASRSGSPVLMIMGADPAGDSLPNGVGPDRKSLNARGMLEAAGIKTFVADDAASARQTFQRAAAAAMKGGVALLLPSDVQMAQIDPVATAPATVSPRQLPARPARDTALSVAVSQLEKSRKPLFLVGVGAWHSGAKDSIVALADRIGAALVTTLKAKDMFRGHPFDCGILGSFSNAGGRRLIEQADCVVAIGAGVNQQTTSWGMALSPDIPIIHIDNNRAHIGRWFDADIGLVGDAKLVVEQLIEALPQRAAEDMPMRSPDNARWLAEFTMEKDFEPLNTPRTMDHRSLALELDAMLPKDRNVIFDSGNMLLMCSYIGVQSPAHFKITTDNASIGLGFGSSIGFAVGAPDRTNLLLLGDGSFMMTISELETVAREGVPLVIGLINDCAYGAELHFLRERNAPTGLSLFPDIDFAPVAEAFGFEAYTIRTLDELRALAPVLAAPDGPIFLDCKVNASVVAPFLTESAAVSRK